MTRPANVTMQDLAHEGICYVNSQNGPAGAEDKSMGSLAEYLLIDPKTGKFRPNNEAILASMIVADGDTTGPNRFIKEQVRLVPTFAGKAMYMSDIGHFIKTISNALYALAGKCSKLQGRNLLEPPRIKAMCSDLSKYLREHGNILKE